MKILIGLTSRSNWSNIGEKAGVWVEEFAAPYYVPADASAELTIASSQITGRNPASSEAAAKQLLELLQLTQ